MLKKILEQEKIDGFSKVTVIADDSYKVEVTAEEVGEELYPTIQAKGTRLGYALIKNHCMLDENKRIGTHAMLVFFALNGIELRHTQKELYEMVLAVADGSLEYDLCLIGFWNIKSNFLLYIVRAFSLCTESECTRLFEFSLDVIYSILILSILLYIFFSRMFDLCGIL